METDRLVERTISSMQPGEHACCVCADDEQFRDAFTRFISDGLEAGQRVVYFYHTHTPEFITDLLEETGIDARAALLSGQLVFRACVDVYGPLERFDPRTVLAAIRAMADEVRYAGYPAMRAAVDMSWAARFLPGSPGAARLVEYEIALSQPGAIPSSLLLCLYNRRSFPAALLTDVCAIHPVTWDGRLLVNNTLYQLPQYEKIRPVHLPPTGDKAAEPQADLPQGELADYARLVSGWGKRAHQKIESLASVQAALQESESRYKAIFDNATDAIFIHDLEGHILEANSVACQRLNYTVGELLGKTPDLVDAPELAGQFPLRINLLRRFGMLSFETVHISRLGELIPVEVNARLINFGGRTVVLSIARDITDRKRAEVAQINANQALASANEALEAANQAFEAANAALSASERKFRLLIETSPDGVLLVDENGHVIEFNPANEQIYGFSAGQVLGKPLAEFYYQSQPSELRLEYRYAAILRTIQQGLETGKADWLGHVIDREICRPDGHHRFIQSIGFPIQTEHGYMIGVITRDVTDHRKAELELEQYRQRLELMVSERTAQLQHEIRERQQAEENLEVMLREIHHRVKNNLNVIIALIDLQKSGQSDPEVLQVFKELQTRAFSMALVHESLYRSPNLAQVDFSGYLHTLVAYLNTAYGSANLHTQVRLNGEAQDLALKIETAIPCGLIVNELVTNALKYAFPVESGIQDGEIIVSLSSKGEGGARSYVLIVRDNGIGLAPEINWQASASLGLQLVQVLTRQLGGQIHLETNMGDSAARGTAWRLEFAERRG